METATIVFAHGLEGSPQGTKSQRLRQLGLPVRVPVRVPDQRGVPLSGRVDQLEHETRAGGILLVGSSYGGLVAALLAQRHPSRFTGLVLCAPALLWAEPPNLAPASLAAPASLSVVIIHGLQDAVVPIQGSRDYRARSLGRVVLHEVEDDHALRASLDLLCQVVIGLAVPSPSR